MFAGDWRYRVLRELGRGGMGSVYLVERTDSGRKEALKVLQPGGLMGGEEAVSRFRREARAIQRLCHPNIVALHDFGRLSDERCYLSMEYVPGKTLRAVLREEHMPLERAARLLMQLADAIDHAHAQGVIHRDLKPGNLLVTEGAAGEELKVLDFGVAKIVDPLYRDSVMSGHGEFFGTPAYVSPEQLTSVGDDARIDIYAFGCIAFELLTGERPFRGRTMEVCEAHLRTPPPSLRALRPEAGIPAELEAVVLRCLEKKPDRRFQRGEAVRAAIAGAIGLPASERTAALK